MMFLRLARTDLEEGKSMLRGLCCSNLYNTTVVIACISDTEAGSMECRVSEGASQIL